MAGRHSAPGRERSGAGSRARRRTRSRALPVLLAVVAAMVVGLGSFAAVGKVSGKPAACGRPVKVDVAAAPEIAPLLEKATRAVESDQPAGAVCVDYDVRSTTPEQVAQTLSDAPHEAPDLWVPDFSVWLTRVAQNRAAPATLAKSLAKSPVVVVGRGVAPPASWREVGMNTVAYLDPLTSSASTAALLSAFGEMAVTGATKAQMGAMMVPLAQRYGAQPHKPTTVADVARAAEQDAVGVMTEQQLVSLQQAGRADGLTAAVPRSGTMVLDYPLAALSQDKSVQDSGRRLAAYLAGSRGDGLLAANGFRNASDTPLASGEGLGTGPFDVLPSPDGPAVTDALRQWAVLTVPSRNLAVVDVSGSMDFTAGRESRIDLAVAAAGGALKLFPDNSQIGLWAFSVGLGGGTRDYRTLVPIRPLGAVQRTAIGKSLGTLPSMTNGGTGLYDTTLAAIRTVQDDYDARAVNNVVLLTDGANDDPGSLSLGGLANTIERERDPARPVRVIAIGMGPDADKPALDKIAAATGGRSYVARNPADIGKVFIDAMLNR